MGKSDREKNRITKAQARQEIAKEYKEKIDSLTFDNIKYRNMLAQYQSENQQLRSRVVALNSKVSQYDRVPDLLLRSLSALDIGGFSEIIKEYCEYRPVQGLYKAACSDDCLDLKHFKFCPYCGKEIRIINED